MSSSIICPTLSLTAYPIHGFQKYWGGYTKGRVHPGQTHTRIAELTQKNRQTSTLTLTPTANQPYIQSNFSLNTWSSDYPEDEFHQNVIMTKVHIIF